jgi:hypothetical protein
LTTGRQEPALGWLDERATRDGTLRLSTIPKLAERIALRREAGEIELRRSPAASSTASSSLRTSEHVLAAERKDWNPVQHRIVVDEVQTMLLLQVPGLAAADKKRKAQLIRRHFNAAWTEIEEVTPLFDQRGRL